MNPEERTPDLCCGIYEDEPTEIDEHSPENLDPEMKIFNTNEI